MEVYHRLRQAFPALIMGWGTPFTAQNVARCAIPPAAIEQYKVNLRRQYPRLEILFDQVTARPINDYCEEIRNAAKSLNDMLATFGYDPIAIPPEMAHQRPGQPVPQPVPQNDDYQPITAPRPEDFMFEATPENSAFIQASMVTGREIYPPFSMYLEWAIANQDYILGNTDYRPKDRLFRRSTYPLYLRDASTYEVFYIYNVPEARQLIRLIDVADAAGYDIVGEDDYYRRYWNERYPDTYQRSFFAHMRNRGYRYDYFKYVKDLPITNPGNPLTPARLQASLTPDQQILIEAWRQRALTPITTPLVEEPSNNNNMKVLGLRNIHEQIVDTHPLERGASQAPVISDIGYSKHVIQTVITDVNSILKGVHETNGLTRQFIMYEGDTAIASAGRRYHKYRYLDRIVNGRRVNEVADEIKTTSEDKDLTNTRLPLWGTKSYLTMLYLELAARGIINEQGQVAI